MLYFEPGCATAKLTGAQANLRYEVRGFDPETGQWLEWGDRTLTADANGEIALPKPPSERDLAVRLRASEF